MENTLYKPVELFPKYLFSYDLVTKIRDQIPLLLKNHLQDKVVLHTWQIKKSSKPYCDTEIKTDEKLDEPGFVQSKPLTASLLSDLSPIEDFLQSASTSDFTYSITPKGPQSLQCEGKR